MSEQENKPTLWLVSWNPIKSGDSIQMRNCTSRMSKKGFTGGAVLSL